MISSRQSKVIIGLLFVRLLHNYQPQTIVIFAIIIKLSNSTAFGGDLTVLVANPCT